MYFLVYFKHAYHVKYPWTDQNNSKKFNFLSLSLVSVFSVLNGIETQGTSSKK